MRITTISTCIIFFLSVFEGVAQTIPFGATSITNFTKIEYQAGTQNWMVDQDSNGLIYFANNKGLLQFDGTYWTTFPLPNGTIVRSVAFDDQKKIYVGAADEFGYLSPDANGKYIYYSLIHLVPESLRSFEDIWKIFIRGESIYFCSDKAIFQLEGEKMLVTKPMNNNRFENFFELEDKIYIQEIDGSVYRLDQQQLRLIIPSNVFPNERIVAMLPHGSDEVLVITFSKGLFLLSESGISLWSVTANSFFQEFQAYCAIQLKNGNYAVGTPQNGVLIIDKNGAPEVHINEKDGLQNNTVLSIAQDVQQNIWLGLDNGVAYAEINSPFSKIQSELGITGTGYASIIQDGKLYMGTNQGLFYLDWNNRRSPLDLQRFQPVKNGLGQVWNINKIGQDIIVGQHKGASFLDGNQLNNFSKIQGAWKFLPLITRPGYALEGTYAGLYLYEDKNIDTGNAANWELIGKVAGFDESTRIFEEDSFGNIWVSHAYKGLYKLKLSNDILKVDSIELFGKEHGLGDGLLINVAKVRNELVFASSKGVLLYNPDRDQFDQHPDFLEIFGENRNFHRLIEDELGNIWFSVDKEFGIIKVEEQGVFNKFEIKYFNQIQDELVDGFEHVFAHDTNNIFIGTEKGFVHYAPLKDKKTAFPFNMLIRNVTSITEQDSVVYYGMPTNGKDVKQEFHYKMNDFRFAFSIPYYEKIGYLTYRFKLEGFNEDWTDWSPKTEKEYTNLNSGDYVFMVQAKNAYGELSDTARFAFTVLPPWYWSWYFRVGYFLLSLLLLFGLVKYIAKREANKTAAFKEEQDQKLERKEAEFKKEVEKSENEIIKLRNEKLNADVKHKTGQLASATMHLVQKSEILIKIKNDLKNVEAEVAQDVKKKIQQITRTIESDIQLDDNWEQFENYFDQVHENFFKRLRLNYPELTPKDQKLCAYLRMNLTTKEIAPLMNISVRGVEISRYRLRKKLNLNSDVNLVTFILEL